MTSLRYSAYYLRTIEQFTAGLKLALGSTGIGKTDAIRDVVCNPLLQQRKSIYLANRKQLVESIGQSLHNPDSLPHAVILHRDLEVVLFTLKNMHQEFYEIFEDEILFTNHVQRWNEKYPNRRVDLPSVRRACTAFEELLEGYTTIPQVLEEKIDEYARLILRAFKAAILGAKNKKGPSPAHKKLINHPVIQSLFPFIAFKYRPEIRLIAMTLQKAFYGFFDGEQTLNLTLLEKNDGGYIIFLDEFDFLENDLVGLICRTPQLRNPFGVAGMFYRAMTKHKLPLEDYPRNEEIREYIIVIKSIIEQLEKKHSLHFPEINQFTSPVPQKRSSMTRSQIKKAKTSPTIFRTQHTISTNYLYLRETNRSFEILTDPEMAEETPSSALCLFDAVSEACDLIIALFRKLRNSDEEILYRELLRHCFQDTVFPEELALITQFSHHRGRSGSTELDALLEKGYSLYDIHDLQQMTDAEEVEVRHFGMHLTPESILVSLAEHNLVFGLSATADIPRFVHHFHLDWLRQHISLIPHDQDDIELIRQLNEQKAIARNNHIDLMVIDGLDVKDKDQQILDQFISLVAQDGDFGNDTHEGHLKARVQLFFAALFWMCENAKESDTHLLFFNTFRQIQLVFDRYATPDHGLFTITKRANTSWFHAYEIRLRERQFIVVFYNAKMGNIVRQNQQAQSCFDELFWEGKPVIVVTQYLSAGNGVNLQYWSSPEKVKQQDFTHIGLLETPYFYFGKPDPELPWDEKIALLKENIWYQAKLYAGKVITEQRFLQVLSTLNDPWEWNRRYQQDSNTRVDALFNHMATFIQALGRVERIWTDMPDQMILLSRDVMRHFQRFCAPEFEQQCQEREPMVSHNVKQLLQHISSELPQLEYAVRCTKDTRLGAKNEQCRQAIKQLLIRLEGFRQGNGDTEARLHWQQIRQAALKHDFRDPLLQTYACIAESSYYHNGMLHLTPQQEILPAHLAQPDTHHWQMDMIYYITKENQVIRDYFLEHGYKLAFSPNGQRFFTPYCYQAILAGAIGEEAITALLRDEGINLEDVPDEVYEVADQKIHSRPWYIDNKYYNEETLNRFSKPVDDPTRHPKLNDEHFIESARLKVEKLRAYHGTAVKLIYINLVSTQPRPRSYYDYDFSPVSFEEASIIIIQGALQRRAPNSYQQAFEYFLYDLHTALQDDQTNR